ncbi:MAG: hypothetical protein Q9195_006429 [Heterodermia aff. obscurata]
MTEKTLMDKQDLTPSGGPPPPNAAAVSDTPEDCTFGKVYRLIFEYLEQLEKLTYHVSMGPDSMTKGKFEDVRKRELKIIEFVDSLQTYSLFKHMVAGWFKSHSHFSTYWTEFLAMCDRWKGKEAWSIDRRNWKRDHDTIAKTIHEIGKAYPKGFQGDTDWTEEYRAVVKTAVQYPHTASTSDPLHITFGGAFCRWKMAFKRMHEETISDIIHGNQEKDFWLDLSKLQDQIIDTTNKLPEHPLFIHLGSDPFCDHDLFLSHWEPLRKLASKWEAMATMEKLNNEWIGSASRIDKRHWREDRKIIDRSIRCFEFVNPKGYKHEPEWKEDYLPLSQLMRKDMNFDI